MTVDKHDHDQTYDGGCTCGFVRYRLNRPPFIVHGCHCTWCQRQSGGAFAINALIEATEVEMLHGQFENTMVPSPSGEGQQIARCPKCKVAVWSNYNYSGLFERVRFIRVGTLDEANLLPPDVHIFTTERQTWFDFPEGALVVDDFYNTQEVFSKESMRRVMKLVDEMNAEEGG